MRKPYLLLLLVPAAALAWACSGDDTKTDGGGTDATTDTGGNDAAKDVTPGTDGGTDGSKDVNTQDVVFSIECVEPANCIDGGDLDAAYPPDASGVVCCGTITGNGQTQCQILGASTACKAPSACGTDFTGLATCSSATVRLCTTDSECQESSDNLCCTAHTGDAGGVHICANQGVAAISGGKITCP